MRAALRGASLGALLAYGASALGVLPWTLAYAPRSGAWGFGGVAGEPVILWYGSLLDALAGGVLGFAVAAWSRRSPPAGWSASVAALLLLVLAYAQRSWFGR